jgi:hypothetical protein
MKNLFILSLLTSLSVVACSQQDARDARNDAAQASHEAADEARQAARDLDAAADNAAHRIPDTAKEHEMFVGTVTGFTAGKTLSIKTAAGDSKSFDLNEKGTKTDLPKHLKKGEKVQVTVDRTGDQKTISVASAK